MHSPSRESQCAEPGAREKEALFHSCKSRIAFEGFIFLLCAHACSCFPGTRTSLPRVTAYLS